MKVTDVKHGYSGPKNASFDEIKTDLLRLLENARKEGVVDEDVNQYLDLINSHPDYVTSSSCYGRITLMDLPNYTKKDSAFLCKTHTKVDANEYWEQLQSMQGKFIWFKMDPLILHISCRNLEAANELLKTKAAAGMKRGGIFFIGDNRVQIELAGTYRMELPVKKEKVLVNKEYFELLIQEANKKFDKNAETWERFRKEFSERL